MISKIHILSAVGTVVLLSFVLCLIFSTNVFGKIVNEWEVDTICTYDARSNTTPERSNCIRLNNVIMVSSSKNFVFLSTKDLEVGSVNLYVFDLRDKNITDSNFVYAGRVTPIVKYKNAYSLLGDPAVICADENLFAYATAGYDFALFDNFVKVKEKNLGGKIMSCDIAKGNIAICVGDNVYLKDRRGNTKWKKEVKGCRNVKILNNNVFVGADNEFSVFSKEGTNIFSKKINVKGMAGTDKIAIIAPDGIYVYDEDSKALNLLIEDPAVIGIAGLNKAVVYVTSSTLKVVDYNKSVIYSYTIKPDDRFVSIKGDKNHAVALTNVKDPDTVIVEVVDGEISSIKKIAIDDINDKAKFYYVKDGIWFSSLLDNDIKFKNLVGVSAAESIAKAEKVLRTIMDVGATPTERKEIEDLLNEMRKEFNKGDYEKVFEIARILEAKGNEIGIYRVLGEKKQVDNLLEMASRRGMVLTTGIKLKYDYAVEKMLAEKYKEAIDDFRSVRIETERYVRDEALTLLSDAEKRKSALEKYFVSTENITKLHARIISERDYVNAFTLFDDVKTLDNLTEERMKELFENAEKAKKEAATPWLMFEADVTEIDEIIIEARIAEDEKDYEKAIEKLFKATKQAREFDTISKAQDVCVIAIVVGIIILGILLIRRPKVKEEE